MRETVEQIAGFVGWYSVERGERPPHAAAGCSYENPIVGCVFTRELTPDEMEIVMQLLDTTAPKNNSYLWDGSQVGWKLVEGCDFRVVVELGAELGSLAPERQDALQNVLGVEHYNGFASSQSSISLLYFDDSAAAARAMTALRCAGFDAETIERPHDLILRDTAAGSHSLIVENEQHLEELVGRMIAAGVPVEKRARSSHR